MQNKRIYLSLPKQSGSEQNYIKSAFESNWITSGGPNVEEFEYKLEGYFGEGSFVTALNSGTSAIHLALILLGVKGGDEVICQSMTFSASANPILYQGAVPVFVDSEIDTWNICPQFLEVAIQDRIKNGRKPKAIIAVHLYGNPYKIEEVHAVANKYSIPVIEDSAEALGSSFKGKKCGTFGSMGILSFNGNKIITTSSGGALISNFEFVKNKALFFATQAKDKAAHYEHSEIGYNYRMSNICAGIGLGQIEILKKNIEERREINAFYKELFKDISQVEVFENTDTNFFSNCWLTTILVDAQNKKDIDREGLRMAFEVADIECRPLWKPMHLQPVFKDYPFYGKSISEKLFEKGLCLPSGNLSLEDKNRIRKVVLDFFV